MQLVSAVVISLFLRPPHFPSTSLSQIVEKAGRDKNRFVFHLFFIRSLASTRLEEDGVI